MTDDRPLSEKEVEAGDCGYTTRVFPKFDVREAVEKLKEFARHGLWDDDEGLIKGIDGIFGNFGEET